MEVRACDPGPKEGETGGSLELSGLIQPSQLGKYQTHEETPSQKKTKRSNCYLRMTLGRFLASFYINTHSHTENGIRLPSGYKVSQMTKNFMFRLQSPSRDSCLILYMQICHLLYFRQKTQL